MSTAYFDDVVKLLPLFFEGAAEFLEAWQEALVDLQCHCNMHGSGKGIVRALASIHMVIGVDWGLGPEHTTKNLNSSVDHGTGTGSSATQTQWVWHDIIKGGGLCSPVANDLIDVHIALRAGAGLPHNQREMVVQLPFMDLCSCLHDGVSKAGLQTIVLLVHCRTRLLQIAKRMNDGNLWRQRYRDCTD